MTTIHGKRSHARPWNHCKWHVVTRMCGAWDMVRTMHQKIQFKISFSFWYIYVLFKNILFVGRELWPHQFLQSPNPIIFSNSFDQSQMKLYAFILWQFYGKFNASPRCVVQSELSFACTSSILPEKLMTYIIFVLRCSVKSLWRWTHEDELTPLLRCFRRR